MFTSHGVNGYFQVIIGVESNCMAATQGAHFMQTPETFKAISLPI